MPLTSQEERCVRLACDYLGHTLGRAWAIQGGPSLDDLWQSTSSPEVVVSDSDGRTAAVEVKRLAGATTDRTYHQSLLSLRRYLTPTCGGHYYLLPCIDLRLPLKKDKKKAVKQEIERVAACLQVGDDAPIRIRREANLALIRPDGPGHIHCCHAQSPVYALSPRLTGAFWLVDCDQWEHAFHTPKALEDFFLALRTACASAVHTGSGNVVWYEEWQLTRTEGDDAVWVVAVTEAHGVGEGVQECVTVNLEKALRKFRERRWADYHVVVLEKADPMMSTSNVLRVFETIDDDELSNLDLVLLVDGSDVEPMWGLPRVPSGN